MTVLKRWMDQMRQYDSIDEAFAVLRLCAGPRKVSRGNTESRGF